MHRAIVILARFQERRRPHAKPYRCNIAVDFRHADRTLYIHCAARRRRQLAHRVRRIVPPIGGIDLSPMIVFIVLIAIQKLVDSYVIMALVQ